MHKKINFKKMWQVYETMRRLIVDHKSPVVLVADDVVGQVG